MAGNIIAYDIWKSCDTCIKYLAGMGGAVAVGYDWPAVEAVMRLKRVKTHPLLFMKLKALERVTVKMLNQRSEANGGN
ncbi:hypothetical protein [Phascolarctobacterium sp.]|uniref:hypothetical protein n=1 Tax=Phascolarctobacterium sp. TaxID=2049039 RepID=UPI0038695CBA